MGMKLATSSLALALLFDVSTLAPPSQATENRTVEV
jgi:hypothetical protein